jgi:hypothetical protein
LFKHSNSCFDLISHSVRFPRPVVRGDAGGSNPASASRYLSRTVRASQTAPS